jgi:integrase
MASVRLKAGSAVWFACYKLPTGAIDGKGRPVFRRVQRSTGLEDKTRARQLAESYERAAMLAGQKRFTEQAARSFLAEISAISAVPVSGEPLREFLGHWLRARTASLSGHTRERYKLAVDQFLEHLGDRAGAPIGDITPRELAAFRDAQTLAGKSPATVNKALGILAIAFDEARAQHGIERNPARGLNVRGAKRVKQHRRPFTFEQFSALLTATSGEWRTMILLCGYTGARQQEAAKINWRQIDLARRRLWLDRSKNSDEHAMPIHRTLAEGLASVWKAAGKPATGPVMPYLSTLQRRAISNHFRRAILPLIGIRQAYAAASEEKGAGRTLAAYSLHSLRHSLSTWLQAAGVEEAMRMELIGHEDPSVNRGYTHSEFAQAAAALALVPAAAS